MILMCQTLRINIIMYIKCLPALSDNYIFVVQNFKDKTSVVIDPANYRVVLDYLKKSRTRLVAILNTHHHQDHIGANKKLIEQFPYVPIYGSEQDKGRIPGQNHYLREGDQFNFANKNAEIFFIPGHTNGHIAYYFPPNSHQETGELFCGDTLFAGGCGRLFEGTAEQMYNSLIKLRTLPNKTRIWCSHEYTVNNLKFALTIEKDNHNLLLRYDKVINLRKNNQATIPSFLQEEKETNPFLRCDYPSLRKIFKTNNPIEIFKKIRQLKDNFS